MDLKATIELIKQPEKLKEAFYANSPTVLRFAFDADPNVRAVIAAGEKALPMIEEEIKKNGPKLHDISLSCFSYILSKIDIHFAAKVLSPVFPKLVERPNSFSKMFVAHTLRLVNNLSVDSRELFFTPDQLRETVKTIER